MRTADLNDTTDASNGDSADSDINIGEHDTDTESDTQEAELDSEHADNIYEIAHNLLRQAHAHMEMPVAHFGAAVPIACTDILFDKVVKTRAEPLEVAGDGSLNRVHPTRTTATSDAPALRITS